MVAPSEFCDVNGDYRGSDGKIYRAAPFVNYTTFSLWDTYQRRPAPHDDPPSAPKMPDIANTMLHIYRQQGKLPVWHLMGNETDCMVGNPGIPALADAVLKGYGSATRGAGLGAQAVGDARRAGYGSAHEMASYILRPLPWREAVKHTT